MGQLYLGFLTKAEASILERGRVIIIPEEVWRKVPHDFEVYKRLKEHIEKKPQRIPCPYYPGHCPMEPRKSSLQGKVCV